MGSEFVFEGQSILYLSIVFMPVHCHRIIDEERTGTEDAVYTITY